VTSKLDPTRPPAAPPPAAPPPYREARKHPRVELPARCWIRGGEHTFYLRVHDVSRGGLSVRAPVPFQPHGTVDVRLELPDGTSVHARAEVRWVRDPAGAEVATGPRMGVSFSEFLEGEEALYKILGNA
jgi:hypothetical protein